MSKPHGEKLAGLLWKMSDIVSEKGKELVERVSLVAKRV
jgi:hypothetical protein